ncbi:MAG TPA: helix-turn-helix domain-containing protein [Segeticoccus sp.]|uniref:helix-turn-helix domain-containing protein n=1 Tax=Segeticoccus sp. TaxID=2706531 RepID=UPI002D7E2FE0|nr:helix-turn-helix domain-containing protein [Segeticoccus sp.]HET8601448.1 helix-turn-helix domain-containing protein [Segeticoccus sp.]
MVAETSHVRSAPGRGPIGRAVGYRYAGMPAGAHRGVPSRWLTLIVTLEEPLDVTDGSGRRGRFDAMVAGLDDTASLIRHEGRMSGVQLDLDPLAARAVFGMPASELVRRSVALEDVWGTAAVRLREQLHEEGDGVARLELVLAEVERRLGEAAAPQPEVAHAWRRLAGADGLVRIEELAREVGCSRRHLSGRFRAELGLSPSRVRRVLRFDRAQRLLASTPRPQLAAIAADAGYADQAHFTRDFTAFAGCPPVSLLQDPLRLAGPDAR